MYITHYFCFNMLSLPSVRVINGCGAVVHKLKLHTFLTGYCLIAYQIKGDTQAILMKCHLLQKCKNLVATILINLESIMCEIKLTQRDRTFLGFVIWLCSKKRSVTCYLATKLYVTFNEFICEWYWKIFQKTKSYEQFSWVTHPSFVKH